MPAKPTPRRGATSPAKARPARSRRTVTVDAAEARKQRSDALLRSAKIPVNQHLPTIERGRARKSDAIADRAVALLAVTMRALGAPAELQAGYAKAFRPAAKLSPVEKRFMAARSPDPHQAVQFGWRVEALQVLLWAIGLIDTLAPPKAVTAPGRLLDAVRVHRSDVGLRAAARRRSHDELLDFSDLMYRYHWAIREAYLRGKPPPRGTNASVVLERDYASRWLVTQGNQAWDDVSCDT